MQEKKGNVRLGERRSGAAAAQSRLDELRDKFVKQGKRSRPGSGAGASAADFIAGASDEVKPRVKRARTSEDAKKVEKKIKKEKKAKKEKKSKKKKKSKSVSTE